MIALNADGSGTHPTYGPMKDWDMSEVTDISALFRYKGTINADVSSWDVSSVTNMLNTFLGASVFNSDISNWAVSRVTNMEAMFAIASVFNSDISKWAVSRVTNMYHMFNQASAFNSDISKWAVTSITGETMMQQIFINSGFKRTLCGNEWDIHKTSWSTSAKLGTSTARYGCCPVGSFMSSPFENQTSYACAHETCRTFTRSTPRMRV